MEQAKKPNAPRVQTLPYFEKTEEGVIPKPEATKPTVPELKAVKLARLKLETAYCLINPEEKKEDDADKDDEL